MDSKIGVENTQGLQADYHKIFISVLLIILPFITIFKKGFLKCYLLLIFLPVNSWSEHGIVVDVFSVFQYVQ